MSSFQVPAKRVHDGVRRLDLLVLHETRSAARIVRLEHGAPGRRVGDRRVDQPRTPGPSVLAGQPSPKLQPLEVVDQHPQLVSGPRRPVV